MYGATTGRRKSYRYNFEATNKVSITDCDGHIYIYTYMATWASRLVASPSSSAMALKKFSCILNNFFILTCSISDGNKSWVWPNLCILKSSREAESCLEVFVTFQRHVQICWNWWAVNFCHSFWDCASKCTSIIVSGGWEFRTGGIVIAIQYQIH